MREGGLDAPVRHPIDWRNPDFTDAQIAAFRSDGADRERRPGARAGARAPRRAPGWWSASATPSTPT